MERSSENIPDGLNVYYMFPLTPGHRGIVASLLMLAVQFDMVHGTFISADSRMTSHLPLRRRQQCLRET